jgi:hypothetical protein
MKFTKDTYTVRELIEALDKCPKSYKVTFCPDSGILVGADMLGIDGTRKIITLFKTT